VRPEERPVKAVVTFAAISGAIYGSAPGPNIKVPVDLGQALSINMGELQTT